MIISIDKFRSVYDQLGRSALGRIDRMAFRKRFEFSRIIENPNRLLEKRASGLFKQLVVIFSDPDTAGKINRQAVRRHHGHQYLWRTTGIDIDPACFLNDLTERFTRPRRGKIKRVFGRSNGKRSHAILNGIHKKLFQEGDVGVLIDIGPIQFHHGEFRIV